jgi:hypothetical protein
MDRVLPPIAIEGWERRAMDWYQFFKDFAARIATVIASGAAAFVAYRLGQNQIMVAKAQAGIAERNWHTENEKVVLEAMI